MTTFKFLSGAVVASLVMTAVPPAFATSSNSAPPSGEGLVDAAVDTVEDLDLPDSVGFDAADGVDFYEKDLTVTFGSGDSEIALGLPAELGSAEPVVGPDHIVVAAPESDLVAVIDPLGDDSARTALAAGEGYADGVVHEYEYSLDLPAGAEVVTAPTGGLLIVQAVSEADIPNDAGSVDLGPVLGDLSKVDQAELASLARQTAAGATPELEVDIPAGTVPVAMLATPWAVDAEGVSLPTTLTYADGVLTQEVDTTGASFPVVSDPAPLVVIALGAAARALAPLAIRAFAATAIKRGSYYTVRGGYRSFTSFKNAHGTKADYQWHHIVESRMIRVRGWDARAIHNPRNLVQIPTQVHQKCVNSWMARTGVRSFGVAAARNQTMRDWVGKQSFKKQHEIGFDLLRHCGVEV